MKPAAQRTVLGAWVILAACLVVFTLISYWYALSIPDDSFISYRYADNLASGQGITFNPGEQPVEGYSNFLWIVSLAALKMIGLDMTVWASRLGWLYGVLAIVLLWWVLRRRGLWQTAGVDGWVAGVIRSPDPLRYPVWKHRCLPPCCWRPCWLWITCLNCVWSGLAWRWD
ncbi:MAG: hypothetical protein R3C44_12005 [Chloroflexota bacterium]